MKLINITAAFVLANLAVVAFAANSHEHSTKMKNTSHSGHQMQSHAVSVKDAWARATPGLVKNGVAYLTVRNDGKYADRIIGVSSETASRTELHTHINDNGILRMRRIKGGIEIPAGDAIAFKPGGIHVMFIGLHKPLIKADSFSASLYFEKAGKKTFTVKVLSIGSMQNIMDDDKTIEHGKHHVK